MCLEGVLEAGRAHSGLGSSSDQPSELKQVGLRVLMKGHGRDCLLGSGQLSTVPGHSWQSGLSGEGHSASLTEDLQPVPCPGLGRFCSRSGWLSCSPPAYPVYMQAASERRPVSASCSAALLKGGGCCSLLSLPDSLSHLLK